MPAGLETFADGTTAFVEANNTGRVLAWHQLGTATPVGTTVHEALAIGKLAGWDVRKVPLTWTDNSDPRGPITGIVPDHFATVRTNPVTLDTDYLGVVGKVFRVLQNEDQADLIAAIVGESHGQVETVGSLDGGRKVFITIKLPTHIMVGGADPVNMYLLVINSHKHGALRVVLTYVRVVCANTLAMALAHKVNSFSLRHSSRVEAQIENIRKGLNLTGEFGSAIQVEFDKMVSTKMTEAAFVKVINRLWKPPTEDMTERTWNSATRRNLQLVQKFTGLTPEQEPIKYTRWGAYNAITDMLDHGTPTSKKGEAAVNARALRAVTRPNETMKIRAFGLLSVS